MRPREAGEVALEVKLRARSGSPGEPLDAAKLPLRVRKPDQARKLTFRSEIDGSVQYYALVPASEPEVKGGGTRPGLVLTLHGAAVEGIGQAQAYAPKPGLHLVAPTNRRPYGFDWEDWGRLDAIEVLDLARTSLGTDPRRTYLTGHSMGGHGTWHLGVTFPDRFAAIAPSAGWVSMWSYAGARRNDKAGPLDAARAPERGTPATRWHWRRTSPLAASTSCTATPTTTCRSARRGRCARCWASSTPTSPITNSPARGTGGDRPASTGPPSSPSSASTPCPRSRTCGASISSLRIPASRRRSTGRRSRHR